MHEVDKTSDLCRIVTNENVVFTRNVNQNFRDTACSAILIAVTYGRCSFNVIIMCSYSELLGYVSGVVYV